MLKYHTKLGKNLERKVGFAVLRTVITVKGDSWHNAPTQESGWVLLPEFGRQSEGYPITL